jgi:cytosine/adenosine deaminase-related metal-dependent hydrolase
MKRTIINVRIYDYQNYIDSGFVIFDEKIIKVGPMNEFQEDGSEVIDGHGQLLLPNFVCAHTHIYSIFARGMILPFNPKNFQDILDQMWWKMDAKINNETTYYSGLCAASEFMKNGVTTIIDHHASGKNILGSLDSLKTALVDVASLRSILCFETSDRFPVQDCIKENIDFCSANHDSTTAGLFGMHASMSISDDTLSQISKVIGDYPIHIHVAESEMDEKDSQIKYGKSIISRLDGYHLIKPNSLIVHGVHITDSELDIVANNKAYMVVNTTSNMNNAVGLPDIMNFKRHGVKVLLGNDGLSTSMATEYLNLFYTARLKNKTPNAINLGDVLDIINDTYDYVSQIFGVKIGKIMPGYESDFLMLPYSPFTPIDNMNAFGHIFFGLYHSFSPRDVYRGGQCLVKNGKLLNSKLERGLNKSIEISTNLWKTIKENK